MHILLAVDGSDFSRKVLEFVAANRAMFVEGHQLTLVYASASIPAYVTRHVGKDVVGNYYAEEHAKVVDPLTADLTRLGITSAGFDLRHGRADEEILQAAADKGAGLIIMGTRGHGALGRALMGSVATKVIAESSIPVLLVK